VESTPFLLSAFCLAPVARVLQRNPAGPGQAVFSWHYPVSLWHILESIKVGSTLGIKAGTKDSGLLWQPRFFPRPAQSIKECSQKVEYVHLNPQRAGPAMRAEGWQESSVHSSSGGLNKAATESRIMAVDCMPLPPSE
jgi:hypothetical protein